LRARKRSPLRLDIGRSDRVARAGSSGLVVVDVAGEDDPVAETISVYLRMLGWDNKRAFRWPLGELPPALGTHELPVVVPEGLAPACVRFSEYSFCAELKRSAGPGLTVAADVDVVARPEDLYWPEGERGEGTIELDAEVVAIGGTVSGRVTGAETISVGPTLNRSVGLPGAAVVPRFEAAATTTVRDGAFSVTIPQHVPPTLYDGSEQAIVWEVRGGDAWRRFAVTDPEGVAGRRDGRTPELLSFLARLAGDRFL